MTTISLCLRNSPKWRRITKLSGLISRCNMPCWWIWPTAWTPSTGWKRKLATAGVSKKKHNLNQRWLNASPFFEHLCALTIWKTSRNFLPNRPELLEKKSWFQAQQKIPLKKSCFRGNTRQLSSGRASKMPFMRCRTSFGGMWPSWRSWNGCLRYFLQKKTRINHSVSGSHQLFVSGKWPVFSKKNYQQINNYQVIQAAVTFFIPDRWRSRNLWEFGSRFHHPQKGHQ